jgi:hypothetical protein
MTDILPENINLQFLAEQQARILGELGHELINHLSLSGEQ